jgi:hypothetical protein
LRHMAGDLGHPIPSILLAARSRLGVASSYEGRAEGFTSHPPLRDAGTEAEVGARPARWCGPPALPSGGASRAPSRCRPSGAGRPRRSAIW